MRACLKNQKGMARMDFGCAMGSSVTLATLAAHQVEQEKQ
jgi:hypothetical protein